MRRTLLHFVLGAAVSAVVLYGLWRAFGPGPRAAVGLAVGMPIIGILAFPLLDSFQAIPRLAAWAAFRKFEGRYYAYRGRQVDIEIDPQAVCWIATAHVRKFLPSLPADAVLARLQPEQVAEMGDPRAWRITSQALRAVLAKSTDPETTKFLLWLDDDVVKPARKRLERGMPMR